jgi:hypothetical protein
MLTLLLACRSETPPDTGSPPAADEVAHRLEPGTDLCAYEDSAPALPATTPSTSVPLDEPAPVYAGCLDGLLTVSAETVLDGAQSETHRASAAMFDVDQLGQFVQTGAWLDPLDKVDDCGVLNYTQPPGAEPTLSPLALGGATVDAGSGPAELAEADDGVWRADLPLPAAFGQAYGFAIAGDDTPLVGVDAIELPDAVKLPDAIELTSPDVSAGYALVRRFDLEVDWTGSSDGTATIELLASSAEGVGPYWLLQCVVEDDGSFVIPHEALEAVPDGLVGVVSLSRDADAWIGTAQGRTFHALAHAGFVGHGVITE